VEKGVKRRLFNIRRTVFGCFAITLMAGSLTARAAEPDPFAPNAPSPIAPETISPNELKVLRSPTQSQPAPATNPTPPQETPIPSIVEPTQLPAPEAVKTVAPSTPTPVPETPVDDSPSFFDSLKNIVMPDENEVEPDKKAVSPPEPLPEKNTSAPAVENIEIPVEAPEVETKAIDLPPPQPTLKTDQPKPDESVKPEEPGWLDKLKQMFSTEETPSKRSSTSMRIPAKQEPSPVKTATIKESQEPKPAPPSGPGYLQLDNMRSGKAQEALASFEVKNTAPTPSKLEPSVLDVEIPAERSTEPIAAEIDPPVTFAEEIQEPRTETKASAAMDKSAPEIPQTTSIDPLTKPTTLAEKIQSSPRPTPSIPEGIRPVASQAEETEENRLTQPPTSLENRKKASTAFKSAEKKPPPDIIATDRIKVAKDEEIGLFDRLKRLFATDKVSETPQAQQVEEPDDHRQGDQIAALPPTSKIQPPRDMVFDNQAWGMGSNLKLGASLTPMERQDLPCFDKTFIGRTHCVHKVDWPESLRDTFNSGTVLYGGTKAIVGYDQGRATRLYALFAEADFDMVVSHFQQIMGTPHHRAQRKLHTLKGPHLENEFVLWHMSQSSSGDGPVTVEIRRYDDIRQTFPDTKNGVVRIFFDQTLPLFKRISPLDFISLR